MSTVIIVDEREREYSNEPQEKKERKCFARQRPVDQAWFVWFVLAVVTSSVLSCIFTYVISYDNNNILTEARNFKGNLNYIGLTGLNGVSGLLGSMTCIAFLSGITGVFLCNKIFMHLFITFHIAVFSTENFMLTVFSLESTRIGNLRFWAFGAYLSSVFACWQVFRIISPSKENVVEKFSAGLFRIGGLATSSILVITITILMAFTQKFKIIGSDDSCVTPDRVLLISLMTIAASCCILAITFFIIEVFLKHDPMNLVVACTFSLCASIVFGYTVQWFIFLWSFYVDEFDRDGSGRVCSLDMMLLITIPAVIGWFVAILHGVGCLLFFESLPGEESEGLVGDLCNLRRICCKRNQDPYTWYMAKLRVVSILQVLVSSIILLVGNVANGFRYKHHESHDFPKSFVSVHLWIGAGVIMCSGLINTFGNHHKGQDTLYFAIPLNCFNFGHSVRSGFQMIILRIPKDYGFWYGELDFEKNDDLGSSRLFQVASCFVFSAVLAMVSILLSLFLKKQLEYKYNSSQMGRLQGADSEKPALQQGILNIDTSHLFK